MSALTGAADVLTARRLAHLRPWPRECASAADRMVTRQLISYPCLTLRVDFLRQAYIRMLSLALGAWPHTHAPSEVEFCSERGLRMLSPRRPSWPAANKAKRKGAAHLPPDVRLHSYPLPHPCQPTCGMHPHPWRYDDAFTFAVTT